MTALLRSVAGLILWAVAFSVIYGLQGLSCAFGWDSVGLAGLSAARIILIATYVGFVIPHAWLCWLLRPAANPRDFLGVLAFASAVIGLISTIYTGMPVLALTICE